MRLDDGKRRVARELRRAVRRHFLMLLEIGRRHWTRQIRRVIITWGDPRQYLRQLPGRARHQSSKKVRHAPTICK